MLFFVDNRHLVLTELNGIRWVFENADRSESSHVGRVIKKAVWASPGKSKRPDMSQQGGKECEESLVRCSRWGPKENKTSMLHGSCGRV